MLVQAQTGLPVRRLRSKVQPHDTSFKACGYGGLPRFIIVPCRISRRVTEAGRWADLSRRRGWMLVFSCRQSLSP